MIENNDKSDAELFTNLITEFCTDISEWIASGCFIESNVFADSFGICNNFEEWLKVVKKLDRLVIKRLSQLLREMFGHDDYPFGGSELYETEKDERSMYKNPVRLAWINKHKKIA